MNNSDMRPFLVSIEGNVGSGKSTLLKKLRELEPEWNFIDEPVESWMKIRNDEGKSLLDVFYHNIKRWSYTFQNAAVLSRGIMIKEAIEEWNRGNRVGTSKSNVFIMERCVETDKHIFASMLKEDGMLDNLEWTLYENWYTFIKTFIPKMDAFVWIDTDYETCSDRIKIRAREGEEDISLDYLKRLEEVHKKWLENEDRSHVIRSTDIDEIRNMIKRLNTTPSHVKGE
jgi:deoxyguanosine kinase